jgi:hypothetical protein
LSDLGFERKIVAPGFARGNRPESVDPVRPLEQGRRGIDIVLIPPGDLLMNSAISSKFVLASLLAGSVFILTACGAGVSGTYTNTNGLVTLDLKSGGKALLTMMGQNEQCSYDVDGKNLNLTCNGEKTVWGIHDDGSLTGPGFVGALTKRKS